MAAAHAARGGITVAPKLPASWQGEPRLQPCKVCYKRKTPVQQPM